MSASDDNQPVSVAVANGLMAFTIVIFASAFAGIRYMLNHMEVMPFTALRLAIGVGGLIVVGAAVGLRRPEPRDVKWLVIAGTCGFSLYHLTLNLGAALVTAGQCALLVSTIPVWTAFAAWKGLGEQIAPRHFVGLGVSIVGIAIMSIEPGDLALGVGSLWVLAGTLCAAVNITITKRLLGRYRPLELTVLTATVGSLPLILWLPTQHDAVAAMDATQWAVAIYLGLVPISFGYWLSTVVLRTLPAYRTSQFLLLIPPVAALIAWLALGEVPTTRMLGGGAVVLAGVAVTIRRRGRTA